MTVNEFYKFLCDRIPSELTLDGDRDGMSCCPSPEREVTKVLIALDCTQAVIDEAIEEECEVILTHHPMLFGGVSEIVAGEYRSDKLIKLIKNDIAVMSFHTRLDALDGGVNDILAALLGLTNVTRFGENGLCRIGELEAPTYAEELAYRVKNTLMCPFVEYSDAERPIRKVAVCGGSGKSMIGEAIAAGADAFVSGEFGHHPLTDSADMGITLIAAGHYFTENPVLSKLFELCAEADVLSIMTFSNRVGAI